jgi:hypothetical protein
VTFGEFTFGEATFSDDATPGAYTPLEGAARDDTGQAYLVQLVPYQLSQIATTRLFTVPIAVDPFAYVPIDTFSAGLTTLYYSDTGYKSGTTGDNANIYFEGRVTQPLKVARTLPVTPEQSRRVALEIGSIEIINADGDLDETIHDYTIDGRAVTVLFGKDTYGYSEFTPVFTGTAQRWHGNFQRVSIDLRDNAYRLSVPIQAAQYTGVGGVNGTADLKGKPLPTCFGKCLNITPVLIDPTYVVFQFHSRTAQAVDAVYDRGSALSATGDHASYAALIAASLTTGQYATCLALGLIRLNTTPSGLVTADVRGDASGSYVDTTFAIAERMITDFALISSGEVETTMFDYWDSVVTGTVGWYYPNESLMADEAISQVIGAAACWWGATSNGLFTCGRLDEPDEDAVTLYLQAYDVIEAEIIDPPSGTSPPRWKQRVGYQRNWTVQTSDIAAAVTASRRQFLAEEYRVVYSASGTVQSDYALAQDPPVMPSLWNSSTDAQAETTRLLNLLGVQRQTVRVRLNELGHVVDIGDTVSLTFPRVNGGDEWFARVIGVDINAKTRNITLTLWG